MSNYANPFTDLTVDRAKELHSALLDALERLTELPNLEAEAHALFKCVESCYVDAVETELP